MGGWMNAPEHLGEVVALAQDTELAQRDDIDLVRIRLMDRARPTGHRQAPLVVGVVATLAAAAAILVVMLWQPSVSVRNSETGDEVVVGTFLASPEDRSLSLSFSDGSEVKLEPRSGARVTRLDHLGGEVLIESGTAQVRVVHSKTSRWTVDAGPFEVRVVGTQFQVSWMPQEEHFVITLRQGHVEVSGPMVAQGRFVEAGETFQVWVRERRAEMRSGEVEAPTHRVPEPTVEPIPTDEQTEDHSSGPHREEQSSTSRTTTPRVQPPTWQELANQGRFAEAVEFAEANGFARVLARSNARELLQLGDAARLGGKTARAMEVYRTIRERFSGSSSASRAAFFLGRISFDRRRSYREAARWFGTYLREQPGGQLSREAAGRRFEALHRAGSAAQARELARRYLRSYPSGPHAPLARQLVEAREE